MASCKDCIHYEVCADYFDAIIECGTTCSFLKDRSRFVELPCKIGDTLYTVVNGYKISEWIITDICFSDYLPISVKVITARDKQNSKHMRFAEYYLEKTVFLTREAAEQALKEEAEVSV